MLIKPAPALGEEVGKRNGAGDRHTNVRIKLNGIMI